MAFLVILGAGWLVILLLLIVLTRVWTGQRPSLSPGLFLIPLALATVAAAIIQFFQYFLLVFHGLRIGISLVVTLAALSMLLLAPAAAIKWIWKRLRSRKLRAASVRTDAEAPARPAPPTQS